MKCLFCYWISPANPLMAFCWFPSGCCFIAHLSTEETLDTWALATVLRLREKIRNRIQGNEEVIFSELSFVFHLLVLCGFFSPVPHILITPILMYFFLWPWNHDISCLPTSNITLFLFFLSHSGICKGRLTLSVFPSSPAFHINSLQFGCSAPHSTKSSLPT